MSTLFHPFRTILMEAYRFIPSAGTAKFKKAELLSGGNVIGTDDKASAAADELNLTFASVFPLNTVANMFCG